MKKIKNLWLSVKLDKEIWIVAYDLNDNPYFKTIIDKVEGENIKFPITWKASFETKYAGQKNIIFHVYNMDIKIKENMNWIIPSKDWMNIKNSECPEDKNPPESILNDDRVRCVPLEITPISEVWDRVEVTFIVNEDWILTFKASDIVESWNPVNIPIDNSSNVSSNLLKIRILMNTLENKVKEKMDEISWFKKW